MNTAKMKRPMHIFAKDFRFKVPLDCNLEERVAADQRPILVSSAEVAETFGAILGLEHEILLAATLDASLRLVRWNVVASGPNINALRLRPIDAFYGTILSKGSGIILIQSRFSTRRELFNSDCENTKKIAEAGQLMGYPLLDHVILDHDGYWSLTVPNINVRTTDRKRGVRRQARTLAS